MSDPFIFVVSDATGDTAEKVVRATLLQFGAGSARLRIFGRSRTEPQVRRIVEEAVQKKAMVVYTLVNPLLRDKLAHLLYEAGIEGVDLIGALMMKTSKYLDTEPAGQPGLLHQLNEDYFKRIEAVEFAVKNDDGQNPRNLFKADIVLVGISRTSKTPVSTYLAQKGYKVTNIPLVLGIDPPRELSEIDQSKICAFTIDLQALVRIRQSRLQHLGLPPDTEYAMREHVMQELRYARQIFSRNPSWPVIDVTSKAIEETASIILAMIEQRRSKAAADAAPSEALSEA